MKFSTRARYGLRMMVEMARELKTDKLVQLGKIAKVTGLSDNYLAQLAIPLKNQGLLIGISGKNGGYRLAKPPEEISVSQIVKAVSGDVKITDCVDNPDICLNSSFCEARLIWVIVNDALTSALEKFTLADLIEKHKVDNIRREYQHIALIDPDRVMSGKDDHEMTGCPVRERK